MYYATFRLCIDPVYDWTWQYLALWYVSFIFKFATLERLTRLSAISLYMFRQLTIIIAETRLRRSKVHSFTFYFFLLRCYWSLLWRRFWNSFGLCCVTQFLTAVMFHFIMHQRLLVTSFNTLVCPLLSNENSQKKWNPTRTI